MTNHSDAVSNETLNEKDNTNKSINTLRIYDDLEEILREAEALIISLLTTDFMEEAEPDKVKDYIRCLQKHIEQAQILVDQFADYFGY